MDSGQALPKPPGSHSLCDRPLLSIFTPALAPMGLGCTYVPQGPMVTRPHVFQPRRTCWGACRTAKAHGAGCVCAHGVLMHVFMCRVCECVGGGADCGGVLCGCGDGRGKHEGKVRGCGDGERGERQCQDACDGVRMCGDGQVGGGTGRRHAWRAAHMNAGGSACGEA